MSRPRYSERRTASSTPPPSRKALSPPPPRRLSPSLQPPLPVYAAARAPLSCSTAASTFPRSRTRPLACPHAPRPHARRPRQAPRRGPMRAGSRARPRRHARSSLPLYAERAGLPSGGPSLLARGAHRRLDDERRSPPLQVATRGRRHKRAPPSCGGNRPGNASRLENATPPKSGETLPPNLNSVPCRTWNNWDLFSPTTLSIDPEYIVSAKSTTVPLRCGAVAPGRREAPRSQFPFFCPHSVRRPPIHPSIYRGAMSTRYERGGRTARSELRVSTK